MRLSRLRDQWCSRCKMFTHNDKGRCLECGALSAGPNSEKPEEGRSA